MSLQPIVFLKNDDVPRLVDISFVRRKDSKVVAIAFGRDDKETASILAERREGLTGWTKEPLDAHRT